MKRLRNIAAALVVLAMGGLFLAGNAEARGPHRHRGHSGHHDHYYGHQQYGHYNHGHHHHGHSHGYYGGGYQNGYYGNGGYYAPYNSGYYGGYQPYGGSRFYYQRPGFGISLGF